MRRSGVLAVTFVAAMSLMVLAAEKPPAEYQNAMKAIGGAQMSMRGNIKTKNYEGIARDAAAMKAALATVEQWWAARKTDDAVQAARAAVKSASDLEAAATARNDEGIVSAQGALGATCMGCHTAHRERLADGTFEIK
jgi:cytochrome c556